jgi:site-specific DNA-methyltransferase (cytosine-N4-specific)
MLIRADARQLPIRSGIVQTVVTSPPYWGLRDYGTARWDGGDEECDHKESTARHDGGRVNLDGFHGSARPDSDKGAMNYRNLCGKCGAKRIDTQLGLEATPEAYVANMVAVFREVWRVLRKDGTVWLNLGDSYATGTTAKRCGCLKLEPKTRPLVDGGTPAGCKPAI